jgi:hypothetical protein
LRRAVFSFCANTLHLFHCFRNLIQNGDQIACGRTAIGDKPLPGSELPCSNPVAGLLEFRGFTRPGHESVVDKTVIPSTEDCIGGRTDARKIIVGNRRRIASGSTDTRHRIL